ncbi:MAG: hypothetical protein P4L74_04810 [Candidatus Doudnabacteria bacterium]|nr:hypothetical protein [Candidatus Doudnabacteria bacterium]
MFGQTKNKTDSKIRWQNPRFRSQLKRARGYKRPAKAKPPTAGGVFLAKIGLGSWISRIITGAVLIFLIYLVFIPNLFFIKNVRISGADGGRAETLTNLYLDKKTPWPQKNLLLMSKIGLQNYLLAQDQQILSVDKITKKLPDTLLVSFTPRTDEYLLITASSSNFTLSTDGLVTGEAELNASGTLPSNLAIIKLDNNPYIPVGQKLFTADESQFLGSLQQKLPGIAKSPIDYYELPNLESGDIDVYLKAGYLVKFNLDFDSDEMINRLNLLLSQMSPGDLKNLYYVDMRFKDRAYTCSKSAPCVNSIPVPNNSTTSTPNSNN